MLETLNNWIISANDWIWTYLLIILLILIGLYFTFKSRFVQFRYFGEMFRLLGQGVSNGKGKNSVSSFQAFCIATASRVGTGNLAGVATAVALGGSGAVFWMWVLALIGSASAFVESTLAQIYKEKGERSFIGGPAFYIGKGLKRKAWPCFSPSLLSSLSAWSSIPSKPIPSQSLFTRYTEPAN